MSDGTVDRRAIVSALVGGSMGFIVGVSSDIMGPEVEEWIREIKIYAEGSDQIVDDRTVRRWRVTVQNPRITKEKGIHLTVAFVQMREGTSLIGHRYRVSGYGSSKTVQDDAFPAYGTGTQISWGPVSKESDIVDNWHEFDNESYRFEMAIPQLGWRDWINLDFLTTADVQKVFITAISQRTRESLSSPVFISSSLTTPLATPVNE